MNHVDHALTPPRLHRQSAGFLDAFDGPHGLQGLVVGPVDRAITTFTNGLLLQLVALTKPREVATDETTPGHRIHGFF